ncbi:hypothetical protein DPMN_040467 [Dreissena polymorpha]|uniref:Uncharacterized protein n=1 Tax=Dreissena polymorpha TaxID=45954 RepID=A0A9D4CYA7_DREPO|nr:hypothetical protein DPMN_040457 [Dreissena polymorpha]KAH3734028.1 hypothetical protein DPMN_040467 [Dreissena polymorpha]
MLDQKGYSRPLVDNKRPPHDSFTTSTQPSFRFPLDHLDLYASSIRSQLDQVDLSSIATRYSHDQIVMRSKITRVEVEWIGYRS